MDSIRDIADRHNLFIVEDACHAINAKREGKTAGSIGDTACFSMHPLKNLNAWGDGGFIIIKDSKDFRKLSLMRNHGLVSRNKTLMFAYNSRLDTIQAVVANHLLKKLKNITKKRISNSNYLDKKLNYFKEVQLIHREKFYRSFSSLLFENKK